jgi:hypothetical protein
MLSHAHWCLPAAPPAAPCCRQLHELLDWAATYSERWSDYVQHVQKQIRFQQRVAKQELIRRLQESEEEEEEEQEVPAQQQQQEKA